MIGLLTTLTIIIRLALSIYRRLILPAKKPLEFGKWAIVTGSTSGINAYLNSYYNK